MDQEEHASGPIIIDDKRVGVGMVIYGTGAYRVKKGAVNKVKKAVAEFVRYIEKHEKGTKFYAAWQQKDDPTRFVHFYIFENERALDVHSNSEAVKRFESVYTPVLAGGPVDFTDYKLVAMNRKI